jgi:hypothetical protein
MSDIFSLQQAQGGQELALDSLCMVESPRAQCAHEQQVLDWARKILLVESTCPRVEHIVGPDGSKEYDKVCAMRAEVLKQLLAQAPELEMEVGMALRMLRGL